MKVLYEITLFLCLKITILSELPLHFTVPHNQSTTYKLKDLVDKPALPKSNESAFRVAFVKHYFHDSRKQKVSVV